VTAAATVPAARVAPGTGALLLDGARVHEVSRRSVDVQVRFGPAGAATRPTPAVVLCTRAADPDADELSLRLAARGVPVVRVDADGRDDDLGWDGAELTIERDGRAYLPRVLWTRLFAPSARAADGLEAPAAQHAAEQAAARAANLGGLPAALTINPGARLLDAPNRLAQLAYARTFGLRTPASLVTHEPARAAGRLSAEDVIVKAVGPHFSEVAPGRAAGLVPRRLRRADLLGIGPQSAPVLVQDAVEHERELRVFVVGGRCLAYALHKPTLDAASEDPGSIAVRPIPLAGEVAGRVLALTAALELDVAAVDLLETGEGEVVFLEVNASGSWRWFEARTRTSAVSEAVCDLLAARFEATA
jgi:glutathione synthase/RimK-type ligase-like ATP-grasp enzyme